MEFKKEVKAHKDAVTCLKVPQALKHLKFLVSSSRDKTLAVVNTDERDDNFGKLLKRQGKHGHFIEKFHLSNDGCFAFTASWDGLVRSIKLRSADSKEKDKKLALLPEIRPKLLKGHTKDVLDVKLCPSEKHMVSVGRDNRIIYWNLQGESKFQLDQEHNDWITSVEFLPQEDEKTLQFITTSWDGTACRFNLQKPEDKITFKENIGCLNCSAVSPDGALVALGSKDGKLSLWEMKGANEVQKNYDLDLGSPVQDIKFHNTLYVLIAATDAGVKIVDLSTQQVNKTVEVKKFKGEKEQKGPGCTTIALDETGANLYSGWTDGSIRF